METITVEKLKRFKAHVQKMLEDLSTCKSLAIHQEIDESYYLEKKAELSLLIEQMDQARTHLNMVQVRVYQHYRCIFIQWSKDARWLNHQFHPPRDSAGYP